MTLPRLMHFNTGIYSGYCVADLNLPEWFTKEHALKVFNDEPFKSAILLEAQSSAKDFGTSEVYDRHHVPALQVSFCKCCGLSYVQYTIGDATALGIDRHSWHEGSSYNHISEHNIDTLAQLVTLYDIWVFYLNGLELKKESWDKAK